MFRNVKAEDMPFPTLQRQVLGLGLKLAFSHRRKCFNGTVGNDVEAALEAHFACRAIDHGKHVRVPYRERQKPMEPALLFSRMSLLDCP